MKMGWEMPGWALLSASAVATNRDVFLKGQKHGFPAFKMPL